MAGKVQFGSKIGLIAVTVGSAVGLGNIWRFPAETQANGGAAFLIVYAVCVMLLGIPVMLGEFAIGRAGGTDAVGDYRRLSPGTPWWIIGATGIVASYLILCFYIVVAGWTFEYLVHSIDGSLFSKVDGTNNATEMFGAKMHEYVQETRGPLIYTWLTIIVTAAVLLCGVRKGIERMSNILMPLLFLLLLVFCAVALSLPGAGEGVNYFLNPDFSKINPGVVIDALGQAFFSLSLGMGILITYAGYFPKDTRLTRTAVTVSLLDMGVAVMMGLIIFPAVTSFGMGDRSLEGATLVFVTLPEVFQRMPATQLWSVMFFLLLLVAALTSVISISEVSVRFFEDRFKMSRFKAVLIVMIPVIGLGSLCSLSQGVLSHVKLFGLDIFSLFDTFATNILLPLGAMAMCVWLGWFSPKGLLKNQLSNDGSIRGSLNGIIGFIIRWIAPIVIAVIMISQFL